MELSGLKEFEKRHGQQGHATLIELLFKQNDLLLTRPGYIGIRGVYDWEPKKETDDERQVRERIEAYDRHKPEEYRNEPSVKPPYLDFHKYLEAHNGVPRGNFPVRVEDIMAIRELIVVPSEQSRYTSPGLVEVRWRNINEPMGAEIRAGYLENIDEIVNARNADLKLYTHLKNGMMQSPLHIESCDITRLNRLFIGEESLGFN